MHSFMKVFHIFVMCVSKWQQKCASANESNTSSIEKSKSSSKCVIEHILDYHRVMTMNLEDEYWEENDNNSSQPW